MPIDKNKLRGAEHVYPLQITPYEEYMVAPENPSVVAKVNALVLSLHGMGRLTNDLVKQWNNVMSWLINGGVEELTLGYTESRIKELLQSGEFGELIEVAINEIHKELTETTKGFEAYMQNFRRNEKLINMKDLAQDIKLALTGGAVAVVGVDAVDTINLKQRSVDVSETKFISQTKNLFNYDTATFGSFIVVNDGVTLVASDTFYYSDWIRVIPNQNIYKSHDGGGIYYDASKKRLSAFNSTQTAGVITTPPEAYFLRVNVPINQIETYQLEYGTSKTAYVRGKNKLVKSIKVDSENIEFLSGKKIIDNSLPITSLSGGKTGANILDPNTAQKGYVDRNTGLIKEEGANTSFYRIPVRGTSIISTPITKGAINVVFYIGETMIPKSDVQIAYDAVTDWIINVPPTATHFSLSVATELLGRFMSSWGVTQKPYEPYYYEISGIVPKQVNLVGGESLLSVSRETSQIIIRVPQPNRGTIIYRLFHEVKPYLDGGTYQNYNGWRLGAVKLERDGVTTDITNDGAWETAISITGYPDFIGTYHGYEKMKNIFVYVDNKKVTSGVKEGKNIRIVYTADLFEQGAENILACNVARTYEFSTKGLELNQKFIDWKKAYPISNAYLVMLPILRTGVTHTAITDIDYKEYDVSKTDVYHPINAQSPNARWAHVFGDKVGASVTVKYANENIPHRLNISDAAQYNKMYFAYSFKTPVNIGDRWEVTAHYDIKG